ncbi:translation protein [Terfezia claveryi]|nr:translation protein [Terfezia claveryi]
MPEENHRLYVKARHISYQRGKRNNNPNTSLVQIEGVANPSEAQFYLGKRVAFVYRAQREGNSGIVRAKFATNLPPKTFGASLRIMLYPSNV